jgi:hypothetical protein
VRQSADRNAAPDHDRTLGDATQHDVDTSIDLGATTGRRVRDFLRWAHARGLSADLQVHWLGREGIPANVLGEDERWTLLRAARPSAER